MVKTKVQDLAKEFGVPSTELLPVLREMGVTARGATSSLDDGQVAAVRVRWEREKRRAAAPQKKAKATPRKKKEEEAPAEVAPVAARPTRRRRTAADVAEAEAVAQAEAAQAAEEALIFEKERTQIAFEVPEPKTGEPMPTIQERARVLFKDEPEVAGSDAPAVESAAAEPKPKPAATTPPPAAPLPSARGAAPPAAKQPFIPPRVRRPEGGPRPVFSSASPAPPRGGRPGASPPTSRPPEAPKPGGGGGGGGAGGTGGARKKGRRNRRPDVDQDVVQANILKTLAGIRGGAGRKRGRSDDPSYRDMMAGLAAEEREREKTRIRVNEFISVSELADIMKVSPSQIVQFAFKELGLMVTMNQRLDFDQIELIAGAFGFEAVREDEYMADVADVVMVEEGTPEPRPPVVTIMGHVDHGKTSLLDFIRKANIVAGEAGGITQHIGAYNVEVAGGKVLTFLDTPGHEAFTAMRARGAKVTDIVVLVIAADDQVMPQTIEAISHARNAGVPMVVAINKVDLPSANIPKVKQDLLQHNVVLEEFGGQVLCVELSAKTGKGVPQLLEQVLLQAEILDLKASPVGAAQGAVLEATLDPGKGPLATVLVRRGTLVAGANFICGKFSGRVRALFDERGNPVKSAGPSVPVQVLGFEGVPSAGDTFMVVADAGQAREIAQKRQRLEREAQNRRSQRGGTLEDISRALQAG
ncbi:MAG: translation initiation factor IF-2, partial [Gemmatimonadota bacterium]